MKFVSSLFIVTVVAVAVLLSLINAKSVTKASSTKSKNDVAIPRSKQSKGKSVFSLFGQSIIQRVAREVKSSFSSDLESLTLQLTKPFDTNIQSRVLEEFIRAIDEEYENPEFLVGILAKLSRKMSEASIYTKLKVILSIHILTNSLSDKAKLAVLQCIKSLRNEIDEKVGSEFFSLQTLDNSAASVSTVGEVEAVELARSHGQYFFNLIDQVDKVLHINHVGKPSTKKSKIVDNVFDRSHLADDILNMLDQNQDLDDLAMKSSCALAKKCIGQLQLDRIWLSKQLTKLYEGGLADSVVRTQVESKLASLDSKFVPIQQRNKEDISITNHTTSTPDDVITPLEDENSTCEPFISESEASTASDSITSVDMKSSSKKQKKVKKVKEDATIIDKEK